MSPQRDDILRFLKENKPYMRDAYRVTRIGLFGSFARNAPTEKSDIDLIVEFEDNTPNLYDLKNDLRRYIREHLDRDVDICREKYIKPYARETIMREAIYV